MDDRLQAGCLRELAWVESHLAALAEALPEGVYGHAPAEGMRTVAEQLRHSATLMFLAAALVLGETSPHGPGAGNNGPELAGKAEVLQFLRAALDYARRAAESLTVANHLELVEGAFGTATRAAIFSGMVAHCFNHYGQLCVYARMLRVLPPASVPA